MFFRAGRKQPVNSIIQATVQELVHQHSIFKLLAQASSRALQLLSRATSKERAKPALLKSYVQLQMLMPLFILAWNCCSADEASEEAALEEPAAAAAAAAGKQLVLQQLQQTDILQTSLAALLRCEDAHSSSSSSSSSSTRSIADESAKAVFEGATMAELNLVESMAKQQASTFAMHEAKEFPRLADAAASDALNMAECSELELVSRKGSRCSGCATARFCSKSCQQQCWKGQHAPVCKRITAARKG
ncbi:hypothetical protein OEZ85_009743 [Tetradesmus obliquus]|uniref:MYND-type domain-containing protein n=1 Tax=Tetradesmus obliquus TaxID=3088 RepID=A0ABY8UCS9_TETOB|nr:hypothetical protein OEZ85_009743 [Tetradesmus obliquus]